MATPELQKQVAQVLPRTWRAWVRLLRPNHWTKNLFCLAGLFFSGRFTDLSAYPPAIMTLMMFSLGASAVYIFNDMRDIELDRQHPRKRFRPLASGEIGAPLGYVTLICFSVLAFTLGMRLDIRSLVCLVLYFAVCTAYSLKLRQVAILDVFCIATGFMLRLLAGIYAVGEMPTAWITICTLFLTLFLGFCKRRSELRNVSSFAELAGQGQRPALADYQLNFLDSLLNSTATMAILTYALFTTASGKSKSLILTTPAVVFAIMRYKQLVMVCEQGEQPEKLVLHDRALQASMFTWVALYFIFSRSGLEIFR